MGRDVYISRRYISEMDEILSSAAGVCLVNRSGGDEIEVVVTVSSIRMTETNASNLKSDRWMNSSFSCDINKLVFLH